MILDLENLRNSDQNESLVKDLNDTPQIALIFKKLYESLNETDRSSEMVEMYESLNTKTEVSEKVYNSAFKKLFKFRIDDLLSVNASKSVHKRCPNKHSQYKCKPCNKKITYKCLPYVITKPGKYSLCHDINFTSCPEDLFAISIDSDNVILDLREYKLQQVGGDPTIAVDIQPGHKNITVKNGTICGFKTPISGFVPAAGPGEEQLTLNGLTFTDLNLSNNGSTDQDISSGIYLDVSQSLRDFPKRQTNFYIFNVMIKRVKVNNCIGVFGIQAIFVDNLILENVQVNNLLQTEENNMVAFFILYSRNITVTNCQGNGTTNTWPFFNGRFVGGIFLGISDNIHVKDCQFNNTYGESNFLIAGGNFLSNHDAVYENVQFNGTTGGSGEDGFGLGALLINAVHVSDFVGQEYRGSGNKYIKCQFNNTKRLGDTPSVVPSQQIITGPAIASVSNLIFDNCESVNNTTTNPNYSSYGFFITSTPDPVSPFDEVNNVTFRNCITSDISSPLQSLGFLIDSFEPIRNIVFENCIVQRIQGFSATGIITISVENVFIRGCRVSDVKGQNPTSSGILVLSCINPVICNNNVNDCTNGIFNAFSEHGLIQNNKVDNCILSGYNDLSLLTTNCSWINNTAFNNGSPSTVLTNYSINWAGVPPITEGDFVNYPIGSEKAYNISMIP